jgi:hypothetical protein
VAEKRLSIVSQFLQKEKKRKKGEEQLTEEVAAADLARRPICIGSIQNKQHDTINTYYIFR